MKLLKIAANTVFALALICLISLGVLCVAALIASGKLVSAIFVGLLMIFAVLDSIGVFD